MFDKSLITGFSILLFITVLTAFTVNTLSPKGIALVGNWDISKGVISANSKNDVIDHKREIADMDLLKKIYETKGIVFLDARSESDFSEGRIKGALSFPPNNFENRIIEFMTSYDTSVKIITYCSGRECEDSHILAQNLSEMGYTNTKVFIDGFPAWEKRGYPIERDE